jgi:hypothetical protein
MFISFLIAIFYQQQIYCIHHANWVSDYYTSSSDSLSSLYLMRLMRWWWWRWRWYFRTRRTRCGKPGCAFRIRVSFKAWRTAGTATKYFPFILACSRLTLIYFLFFTTWLDSWF